ncbi:hypothetical protein OS493_020800 [Desmophyllum pertusum]|uniref:Cytidine and dCMP deaminase domain-containing protein 1 n=1 Tax=Desmophyllum pertusum TaxID=174260 RepID=A0A9W9YBA5_9CNID|nr:hypothetical protein OS493_020800 [Desmophyllum pertusum]
MEDERGRTNNHEQMMPTCSQQSSSQDGYCREKRETRISKENLYMVLALWMERFPIQSSRVQPYPNSGNSKKFKNVGVVFVLPTDRVLAADCSRDGVHGVARVMVNHCGKLEGCKVFVSRKPCSLCAKLLVQSRVSRVFYLPIEPESENEGELARADNLFKVSPVGQSVFVPCVEERVLTKDEKRLPEEITPDDIGKCRDQLFEEWWSAEWIKRAKVCLPWPCLDDRMKTQVESDFKSLMKWIAVVKAPMDKGVVFRKVTVTDGLVIKCDRDADHYSDFNIASHMMIFAKMLARQTDDPKKGVGAVIMKGTEDKEVATLGWNGFPSKALYGEFPRASDNDDALETKFPYVIHAEQNALLVRNAKDLTDGVLFVTKLPCDECAPMIKLSGVKTVVVGEMIEGSSQGGGELSYDLIRVYIKEGIISCYQMETQKTPAKRLSSYPELRKKMKSS